MKSLLTMILLMFLLAACENKNEGKVVYLVRHAEKESTPKNDPPLSTEGVMRSVDLQHWFKQIAVDTIFSTDFNRTMETVQPLAEEKGLDIGIYEAKEFEAFAELIYSLESDTILVVGHSNTLLEQIEAFGIDRPQPEIREEEYDKIFEVRLGEKELVTHTYGKAY